MEGAALLDGPEDTQATVVPVGEISRRVWQCAGGCFWNVEALAEVSEDVWTWFPKRESDIS
eukprot:9456252-Pyramimonas_sp.AAC.1